MSRIWLYYANRKQIHQGDLREISLGSSHYPRLIVPARRNKRYTHFKLPRIIPAKNAAS